MPVASDTGPSSSRPLPWTLIAASVCLIIYALVILFQPDVLALMGISLGGRSRAHMMVRVVGAFVLVWGLLQAARWAWWAATAFGVLASITGIFGVLYPGRFGQVHYLVDSITAPIGIAAIMMLTVLLLLPQTLAVFRDSPG